MYQSRLTKNRYLFWLMTLYKTILSFIFVLVSALPSLAQNSSGRQTILFNYDWQFHLGEVHNASEIDFNDKDWVKIDLPHDYSIEGSFSPDLPSCNGYLPGGIGWYRKTFVARADQKGKQVFIHFDGVYKNSEVWINGHYLGKRPSGYIAFAYDLTKWIKFGQSNTIAVKTDHTDLTDSGWYTGSGIYRNVHLIYKNQTHIKQWGVYATTKIVSAAKATVYVSVDLVNKLAISTDANVEVSLTNAAGKTVAFSKINKSVSAGDTSNVKLELHVENPALWSVETPHLYSLTTSIKIAGHIVDREITRLGIRELRFDADNGLFLNGKNIKLKGVSMVQDAGVLGSAVPRKVWEKRLTILKSMGCNAIRACHNPHATEFLDVCDELGFMVIDEAYDEWEQPKTKWIDGWNQTKKVKNGYYKYFPEWGKQDLRDQILRDRNHPSVIMWSIGNEIDFPNDPYSHRSLDSTGNPQTFAKYMPENPDAGRLQEIAHELAYVVKKNDTTRPVTAGLASAFMSSQVGFAAELDVVGYNYQEGAYPVNHKKYPRQVLYGSENGHRFEYWKAVTDNKYILGQFLWTGFEYLGESFKWPQRTNPFGIIDLGGFLKPEGYFRQSLWAEKPMAYIGAWDTTMVEPTIYYLWDHKNALPHWNWEQGKILKVSGFTNCEEMELILNGKSLGTRKMTDFPNRVITWILPYEKGTLKAIARTGGKELAHYELITAGEPSLLKATSDVKSLKADRRDVGRIVVNIADPANVPHYLAENRIHVKTEGPVRLLGIENSDPMDTERYKNSEHKAHRGRVAVYLQALSVAGKAKITFSSPGLKSAVVDLNIVK